VTCKSIHPTFLTGHSTKHGALVGCVNVLRFVGTIAVSDDNNNNNNNNKNENTLTRLIAIKVKMTPTFSEFARNVSGEQHLVQIIGSFYEFQKRDDSRVYI
jgi:hypothetical protein